MASTAKPDTASTFTFDATLWLRALVAIGGGYALTPEPERRLWLFVNHCDPDELTPIMAQLIGNRERQEAIRDAIVSKQNGEALP